MVVTIVLLIILATISINAIINSRLIDITKQAKQEYETKKELERLELIKSQEVIEGLGKVTVDSYVDELIEQGITTKVEVTDNGDGTKTVITDEGYVVLIKPNPDNIDNDIIIEIEGKADNLPVKIENIELTETSNSIEVKVMVKRGEEATYKYWYREEEGEYKLAHEGKETTYKIEGLKSETRYIIKVEATNKSGTVYKEEVGYTGIITPAQGAITFENLSWSSGKASTKVTKTTSDSYKIEYQVTNSSGTVTVEYKEIASGGTIANLNLGDLVTIRLTDGINHGSTASLNVTDITPPSVTVAKGTVTCNSIQVNVTATDGQAGMLASPSYKYYIKKSSDANYPTTPTKIQTSTSYTFTGLAQNTKYDIKVEVADKAGNEGRGEIKGATTTVAEIKVTEPIISTSTSATSSTPANSVEKGTPVYIKFTATINADNGICTIDKTIPYQVSSNGTYVFIVTGTYGNNKTITKEVQVKVSQYKVQGGFVQYNAGEWTQDEIQELQNKKLYDINIAKLIGDGTYKLKSESGLNFTFGGFTYKGDTTNKGAINAGTIITSRNQSVAPQANDGTPKYDGWQILESEERNGKTYVTKLVHAGSPENFVYYYATDYDGYRAEYLLTGQANYGNAYKTLKTGETINPRNWDMYRDKELDAKGYIKDVHAMTYNEALAITGNESNTTGIRNTGACYWLASDNSYDYSLWYVNYDGSIDRYDSYCWGVRPVVSLESGVYIESGDGLEGSPYILGK